MQPGAQVPHFEATTVEGRRISYRQLWQRRNLVLIVVADAAAAAPYLDSLRASEADLTAHDTALVVTAGPVGDLRPNAVLIADRWGEIHHVADGLPLDRLPDPASLVEWLRFVQVQCPECQGETR
ncbi:MAG TPA: hypothetical protein VFX12_07620 [Vicinamibacterales bacterium]|nr:hypothetical protein [Vicinamibacterales bacterium]